MLGRLFSLIPDMCTPIVYQPDNISLSNYNIIETD